MDWRGPPGQRKSPKCQSPETRLVHVCQSARRDCRVFTNPGAWIGAHTVQLRAHISQLCMPAERGNMAADPGQSGHQAHIYEMCLSAERGIDMDTGKEVLFVLPLFKLFSPSTTHQTPSSSSGSAFRFTVWQTRNSEQQCCLRFN